LNVRPKDFELFWMMQLRTKLKGVINRLITPLAASCSPGRPGCPFSEYQRSWQTTKLVSKTRPPCN